jgi:hypothetical protein
MSKDKRCKHDLSGWTTLTRMHLPWGFLFCRVCGYIPTENDVKKWRLDGERNEEYDGTQTKNSDR